jgi:hypothetical protein
VSKEDRQQGKRNSREDKRHGKQADEDAQAEDRRRTAGENQPRRGGQGRRSGGARRNRIKEAKKQAEIDKRHQKEISDAQARLRLRKPLKRNSQASEQVGGFQTWRSSSV